MLQFRSAVLETLTQTEELPQAFFTFILFLSKKALGWEKIATLKFRLILFGSHSAIKSLNLSFIDKIVADPSLYMDASTKVKRQVHLGLQRAIFIVVSNFFLNNRFGSNMKTSSWRRSNQ